MQSETLGIGELIGNRREDVLRLAAQYGASRVRVFGSVARGEASAASDIDLLVSFPPDKSIFELVELWQELSELLQREVDLVTDTDLQRSTFKQRILREAVALSL